MKKCFDVGAEQVDDDLKDASAIFQQSRIPVIYRPGGELPLQVRLPYHQDNGQWLRPNEQSRRPRWNNCERCWEVPRSWLDSVVMHVVLRFGSAYLVQPYRRMEKCAPACWNATGFQCECSCMGQNHGEGQPSGKWYVISDACAIRWGEQELSCKLIRRAGAQR